MTISSVAGGSWSFPAVLEEHDGEFIVQIVDMPEALTGARDRAETLALAADALEVVVLHRLAHGEAVPDPRPAGPGEVDVPLDPTTAARVAFARQLTRQRLSQVAAAARIGRDEKVVRRILDGRGPVRFETVQDALTKIGAPPALAFTPTS